MLWTCQPPSAPSTIVMGKVLRETQPGLLLSSGSPPHSQCAWLMPMHSSTAPSSMIGTFGSGVPTLSRKGVSPCESGGFCAHERGVASRANRASGRNILVFTSVFRSDSSAAQYSKGVFLRIVPGARLIMSSAASVRRRRARRSCHPSREERPLSASCHSVPRRVRHPGTRRRRAGWCPVRP